MEHEYEKICRICLEDSQQMYELFTLVVSPDEFHILTVPADELHIVDFIRKMTGLKLIDGDKLPKQICNECTRIVKECIKFSQLCIESDMRLRNQETRRILRRIEEEALGEEVDVKCENFIEVSEDHLEQIDDNSTDNVRPLNCSSDNTNKIVTEQPEVLILSKCETSVREKYKCNVCYIIFNNKTKLQRHEKTHDESKPFRCKECLQTFSKKLHLNVHLRSHIKQEDRKFTCKICGQQFIFEYLLKQHEFKHLDQKPFPCLKCNKGCLTSESLRRHMKIHEENYIKKTHICGFCKKEFAYPSFLAEHMKNHTGEKPYLCSVCGKGFRQSGSLHYHQRIHTGFKPFKCTVCDEHFMSQSVLKVHMRKHTNERPFVCDMCGMSFRQSTDLKCHYRTHTGDRPILCTICGKKMCTTGQLTVHVRSHTGEKPYSCSTCSRGFATKTMLVKHERIHTGERPYICDICGKAFNQSSTLKTHSSIHSNNFVKKKRKNIKGTILNKAIVVNTNEIMSDSEQREGVKAKFTVILPAPIPLLQNV